MRAVLMAILATISSSGLARYFPVQKADKSIVQDASDRWIKKNGGSAQAMNGRIPITMYLSNKRCVELYLIPPAIGGVPVYCYDLKISKLLVALDDVE